MPPLPDSPPPPSPHRRRKLLIAAALLIVLAPCIFIAWRLWSTHGYRAAQGIYLADGGQSFIRIKARPFGGLYLTDGYIVATTLRGFPEVTVDIRFRRDKLLFEQKERFQDDIISIPIITKAFLNLRLKPAANGDWNITAADYQLVTQSWIRIACKIVTRAIATRNFHDLTDEIRQVKSLVQSTLMQNPLLYLRLPQSAPPLASFLHRLDDERIPEYFALRRQWTDPDACLQLIRAICADRPDAPFLMLHLAELEAVAGNLADARKTHDRWKQLHQSHADPIPSIVADRAYRAIARAEWPLQYGSIPRYPEVFSSNGSLSPPPLPAPWDRTLEGWMRYLRDRSRIPRIHFGNDPIVKTSQRIRSGKIENFDIFIPQMAAKMSGTLANFALLNGQRNQALELLLGACRLGLDMNAAPDFVCRFIGIAIREISAKGLSIFALNACETEQELNRFIREIDRLADTPDQMRASEILLGAWSPLQFQMESKKDCSLLMLHAPEFITRHRAADARMANLRAAARARLQFIRSGALPASTGQLAPLFGGHPPRDPFAPGLSIACAPTSLGCAIYSIGPDRIDQRAAIEYDPTNGTTSKGDITLPVFRQRQYPFPSNGLRAADARDLLRQFPEGLPLDNFYSPFRLAILDATTTTPVVIFSIGPNIETSGPTDPTLWNFPIPPRQPVYRRAFTDPAPSGAYRLQPTYDPTNGTTSNGDLYIEIPRP